MNSLRNRWVEDIVIAVIDGHRSLSADERADLHRPIQPLLPVRFAAWKERPALAR